MKGTIAICLQNLVTEKYGKDKWLNILIKSGLPNDLKIYEHHDIDDNVIMNVLTNT